MNIATTSIGLSNPKSPENVASVMRAAGNYRVDRVLYTGERYSWALRRNPNIPRLSRKVSEHIPLMQVDDLVDALEKNTQIVCVEFAENAIALPEYRHPDKAIYIFGPEDGTLEQSIIDRADAVVYVPTIGCMNLAATVNVVLYDRLAKSSQEFDHNELIRQSRDTNNTVKVR